MKIYCKLQCSTAVSLTSVSLIVWSDFELYSSILTVRNCLIATAEAVLLYWVCGVTMVVQVQQFFSYKGFNIVILRKLDLTFSARSIVFVSFLLCLGCRFWEPAGGSQVAEGHSSGTRKTYPNAGGKSSRNRSKQPTKWFRQWRERPQRRGRRSAGQRRKGFINWRRRHLGRICLNDMCTSVMCLHACLAFSLEKKAVIFYVWLWNQNRYISKNICHDFCKV